MLTHKIRSRQTYGFTQKCSPGLVALLLATSMGCDGTASPPPSPPPPSPTGFWVAGDFHVHSMGASNDVSGGGGFPDEIKLLAIERNLDFVVLTDHSNATGSDLEGTEEDPERYNRGPEFTHSEWAAELTDATFVMAVGSEISTEDTNPPRGPSGHVGCLPPVGAFDLDTGFVDRPFGAVGGASAVEQANDRGCFSVVNHPYSGVASWIQYDWGSRDYDAIEVWNGGLRFDDADEDALAAVLCDHLSGKRTTIVGGSDMHRLTDTIEASPLGTPLAFPTTWVFTESLSWAGIRAGLEAGHTVVADFDSFVDVQVKDQNGNVVGTAGDTIAVGTTLAIRARTNVSSSLQVLVFGPDSCAYDPRAPNVPLAPTVVREDRRLLVGVEPGEDTIASVDVDSALSGRVILIRMDTDAPDGHVLVAPLTVE